MGFIFNIRKKILEKQIDHENKKLEKYKQKVKASEKIEKLNTQRIKLKTDQELELERLRTTASRSMEKGLTNKEKKFLKQKEQEHKIKVEKRKEMAKQIGRGLVILGKGIGKQIKKASKQPQRRRRRIRRSNKRLGF